MVKQVWTRNYVPTFERLVTAYIIAGAVGEHIIQDISNEMALSTFSLSKSLMNFIFKYHFETRLKQQ